MSTAPTPDTTTEPSRIRRARSLVLGLVGLLLALDVLLEATPRPPVVDAPVGAVAMNNLLIAAGDSPTPTWLLIGDSVLVGDTSAERSPEWREHRLIDYLRREAAVDAPIEFHQAAYSGLLPVDMLAIVKALDVLDPDGSTSLLLELSPRYFSPVYARQAEPSRAWFTELAELADGGPAGVAWARARAWIDRWTPVYRHRERFAGARERLVGASLAAAGRREGDRAEGLARVGVHYRAADLGAASLQAAAIAEIAARARARGRRVAFFATPVEDGFLDRLVDPRSQGEYLGELARRIAPDGRQVALLPMDHPLFDASCFWDHVHLRPEGHRLLAENLLVQLGVRLGRVPPATELITDDAADASLIARIDAGSSDGAAWQAQLARPQGIAVDRGGTRAVIADTDNHVLRELRGDMRIVVTVAGVAGEPGSDDGPGLEARLHRPTAPVFAGADLYFIDADGRALRRLDATGEVTTPWPSRSRKALIRALRTHEGALYRLETLGRTARIVRQGLADPRARPTEIVHVSGEDERLIAAFDLDPGGDLYIATRGGRVLRIAGAAAAAHAIDLEDPAAKIEVLFDNQVTEATPRAVIPQEKNQLYPQPFDRVRLSEVVDLRWVERYGGLLIQDLTPQPKRGKYDNPITERALLRFLDLERRQVYPWLRPLVAGVGYFYRNGGTDGFASYFHEGSFALHQESATLFYLEASRSRLIRVGDGIRGLAEIGNVNYRGLGFSDVLTSKAGERATADLHPQAHLGDVEPFQRRAGPYTWLIVGSSMMAMSEKIGQYSLARILARRLAFELGVRDRIALHTFQRTIAGGAIERQIEVIDSFLESGGRPDVILIESNASNFLADDASRANMAELLDALHGRARHWGSRLIILDTSPYFARNRDALRSRPAKIVEFLAMARQRGVSVIDVADGMLAEHLEVSPIAMPPISGIHMAPWAVDALGERVAAELAPLLRAHLRGRLPAARARRAADGGRSLRPALAEAFDAVAVDWEARLPGVPLAAMQSVYERDRLRVFLDLGQLAERLVGEDDLDPVILACVYEFVIRQRNGAREAVVKIGRFSGYDEYGAGVEAGAEVLVEVRLDRSALAAMIERFAAR